MTRSLRITRAALRKLFRAEEYDTIADLAVDIEDGSETTVEDDVFYGGGDEWFWTRERGGGGFLVHIIADAPNTFDLDEV